jgi:hypothetical protein
MSIFLFAIFVVFSCASKHEQTRTSKDDIVAAAKAYLADKTFPAKSTASVTSATQTVINGFAAQVNAMSAGPQKTKALNALNNLQQHAQRNVESFEKKAKSVLERRSTAFEESETESRRAPFKGDRPTPIADLDIKIAGLQNSTVMDEYKAAMHVASMEQIGDASKKKRLPQKKFVKTIKK